MAHSSRNNCPVCDLVIHKKSLYRHLRACHKYSEEQCLQMKNENKLALASSLVICPVCNERIADQEALANHCSQQHSQNGANGQPQDYTVFLKRFGNEQEYEQWLSEECKKNCTAFWQRSKDRSKSGTKIRLRYTFRVYPFYHSMSQVIQLVREEDSEKKTKLSFISREDLWNVSKKYKIEPPCEDSTDATSVTIRRKEQRYRKLNEIMRTYATLECRAKSLAETDSDDSLKRLYRILKHLKRAASAASDDLTSSPKLAKQRVRQEVQDVELLQREKPRKSEAEIAVVYEQMDIMSNSLPYEGPGPSWC